MYFCRMMLLVAQSNKQLNSQTVEQSNSRNSQTVGQSDSQTVGQPDRIPGAVIIRLCVKAFVMDWHHRSLEGGCTV
jgi:hypothetical protein